MTPPAEVDEAAEVRAYVAAIDSSQRPLFDRIHRLVLEAHPDAELGWSYGMPTFRVGEQGLHVAAWKRWVALYGWSYERSADFLARHPETDATGKGTLQLRPSVAEAIDDDELRRFLHDALAP